MLPNLAICVGKKFISSLSKVRKLIHFYCNPCDFGLFLKSDSHRTLGKIKTIIYSPMIKLSEEGHSHKKRKAITFRKK